MAYQGFKAVEASAAASGARNPAAVAAAVGRKKYGAKKFQEAAAKGKKMKGMRPRKKAKAANRGGIAEDLFSKE